MLPWRSLREANDLNMESWGLYCQKIESGLKIPDAKSAQLNRFKARYDLARNFKKLEIIKATERTTKGYASIFSVFLAYNAAEKLGNIIDFQVLKWELNDIELAAQLRKLLIVLNLDVDEFVQGKLKDYFDDFMQGGTDNIRIPATVIRNSFAHGSLTPSILKATTKGRQKTLNRVAVILLKETKRIFTNWVDSLES